MYLGENFQDVALNKNVKQFFSQKMSKSKLKCKTITKTKLSQIVQLTCVFFVRLCTSESMEDMLQHVDLLQLLATWIVLDSNIAIEVIWQYIVQH